MARTSQLGSPVAEPGTLVLGYSGPVALSGTVTDSVSVSGTLTTTAPLSGSVVCVTTVNGTVRFRAAHITLIREKPPLRLHTIISTPSGRTYRWANDEPAPENVPSGKSFSDTMPGGFENWTATLPRKPNVDYPDLAEFSTIQEVGAGGLIAWEGRLETTPRTSGDQRSITPGAVGFQAALDDNASAREIFVHRDMSIWQGPSVQRQVEWLTNPPGAVVANSPSSTPDPATGFPSLDCQLTGPWAQSQVSEGWLDAQGIVLGSAYGAWKQGGSIPEGTSAWGWGVFLCDDDRALTGAYDTSGNFNTTPGSTVRNASTGSRKWALVQFFSIAAPGGQDGIQYDLFWTCLAVYGNHGLPLHGSNSATDAQGILASDAVAYAVGRWAPELQFTAGSAGTIVPSTFVIPHSVFMDPTTAGQMVKQLSGYELQDWAVWQDKTFWWYPRGYYGRKWRARVRPSQLQEVGPQVDRLWNGVMVTWSDVTGAQRTVGPPGSGALVEDASLHDPDPLNPVNEAGLTRIAPLQIGTTTLAGAIKIGQVFLAEQKLLSTAGQAQLPAYVEDENGVLWPSWLVRSGDRISFIDGQDFSYRRIVSAGWNEDGKTRTISLDSPPDPLQALLARLSAVIGPLGFT